ncbi:MAG TPA: hypothetical protein VM658_05730 [bacterium]|nr:hypothetical protein [bacterium]
MKRIFLYIFLAAAAVVLAVVFHRELLGAITFLYARPNRDLTDQELDARIASVGAELAQIQGHYDGLPGKLPDRSLSQHATARELMDQSESVVEQWQALQAEQAWRRTRNSYLPHAGLLISALVFLDTARRIRRDRDPRVRRREKFQQGLNRELARERGAKPAQAAARRAEAMSAVDPRLASLKPGSSVRQDVMSILGQPHERTVFLEYEAWIYYLPSARPGAEADADAGTEDDPWGTAQPEPEPRARKELTPVTVLFSGNLVHDLSIGTIRDQKDMRRIL